MKINLFLRRFFTYFTIFLLAALALTCAVSPNYYGLPGKADDMVPLSEKVISGVLPNGLRYYILENARPENRAHLTLAVNAGSVLETGEERGFAHFVEHLCFNDTERFPKLELIEYLRSLGMRFGADANAYTSYDETVYGFDVPVEIIDGVKKIPDRALEILDDWTHRVSFKPEDVESESRVVLEELRSRQGAMDRVRKITLPVLFEGSKYAQREPIGLASIIENATSRQLRDFYERWYTADNMALIFAGDFDGKVLEAGLASRFTMPAPVKKIDRPQYNLPPPKNNNFKVKIITDPELTTVSYSIYYKQKNTERKGTLKFYRRNVIDTLIDIMLSMRFEETASQPDSAAVNSWGGMWYWSNAGSFFSMGVRPKAGYTEEALRELLTEKESVRRFGFTESELDIAKMSIMSYLENIYSEKDTQNSRNYIRSLTSRFLSGEDMADIEWEIETVKAILDKLTLKEISKTVNNYFKINDCVVFLTAPQAEEASLPPEQRIREIFSQTAKTKMTAVSKSAVTDELLKTPPVPGSITSEETDVGTGARIITLGNGVRVILKATENKNNEIILYAAAKGGTTNAPENEIISVSLVSEMAAASGLGPYSRTDLTKKLAGKQASFSFWLYDYYRGFQGSSTAGDLKTLFEMIYLFFTEPSFDDGTIKAMLDQYRTNLAHLDDDPQRVFSREISKTVNNGNIYFKPLELSDIDKADADKAFNFLLKCLNPQDYTFVFTGNINFDEVKLLLKQYVASIPVSAPMNIWKDPRVIRPGKTEKQITKGKDNRSFVYLAWFADGTADFSEEKNQTAALLSEYLDIVLTDEIREKLGGVYSISSGASVTTIPAGESRLYAYFICDPERVNELTTAVIERITQIALNGIDSDIFTKSREALIKEYENSMQRNLYIAQSYANSSALYNTPLNRLNTRVDVIRSVKTGEVQALCGELIASGLIQLVMYPER
jgi:zinc protease